MSCSSQARTRRAAHLGHRSNTERHRDSQRLPGACRQCLPRQTTLTLTKIFDRSRWPGCEILSRERMATARTAIRLTAHQFSSIAYRKGQQTEAHRVRYSWVRRCVCARVQAPDDVARAVLVLQLGWACYCIRTNASAWLSVRRTRGNKVMRALCRGARAIGRFDSQRDV